MLCEAGCNKDFANKYGVTPIAEAVQKGRFCHKYILWIKTTVDLFIIIYMNCEIKCTGMCECVKSVIISFLFFLDHIDIVEYLIQHGCDVNKTDINNVSALHIACQKGNYDAVRLLLNGDF